MGIRNLIAVILLAQLTTADRTAIERYRTALQSAESGGAPGAIEVAFNAVGPLRDALIGKLEDLPADEYKRLEQQLPGLLVNREEVVFIKPDVAYFAKLSAARGDDADRAFFAALKATYPESVWPVYIEQQTDYSGCTRFGSGTLVATYRVWSEFQRRFPTRYVTAARQESDAVLQELQSTCACGGVAGADQELEQFIRNFPTAPVRARRSDIRPNCISG